MCAAIKKKKIIIIPTENYYNFLRDTYINIDMYFDIYIESIKSSLLTKYLTTAWSQLKTRPGIATDYYSKEL